MKTIMLFDPSINSLNRGDEIIMSSVEKELKQAGVFDHAFVIRCATHTPTVTAYQNTKRNSRMKIYDNVTYKLICGSNLLWKDMFKPLPSLNANLWNCRPLKGSVLAGIGIGQAESKGNWYTRKLYSEILNKELIHSARDQATADYLTEMGYKAIDTGCPTMWRFTESFCKEIPVKKADNVVFTLTDYRKDPVYDQKLINILKKEYKKVYFWVQGVSDYPYFKNFQNTEDIIVVDPTLEAYAQVLDEDDIEYVGTRLHGGMFALQHRKRTVILAVDNRVKDLSKSYKLNTLNREDVDMLGDYIHSDLVTEIKLKQDNIDLWLSQFAGNHV